MALHRLTVRSPWTGDGQTARTAYRPLVCDQHAAAYMQVREDAPARSGGTVLVELHVTPAVLAAIQSDAIDKARAVEIA